jgi:hypothetical protein
MDPRKRELESNKEKNKLKRENGRKKKKQIEDIQSEQLKAPSNEQRKNEGKLSYVKIKHYIEVSTARRAS